MAYGYKSVLASLTVANTKAHKSWTLYEGNAVPVTAGTVPHEKPHGTRRPRQHDRFVLIGLCWLYGRSEFPPPL